MNYVKPPESTVPLSITITASQFDLLKEMELDMIDDLNGIWENEHQNSSWTLSKRVSVLCTCFKKNERFVKLILSNEDTNSEFASLLIESAHVRTIYKAVFFAERTSAGLI